MKTNTNLFVLTGGPGAGKTCVLEELRKREFICVDEVARRIIREQSERGEDALPWGNVSRYTQRMLSRSVDIYTEYSSVAELTFLDRGIPDTYAYARLTDQMSEDIRMSAYNHRYNETVFFFPPWEDIYCMDSERKQDFAEAIRTYQVITDCYGELGYKGIEVPFLPVPQRVDFIIGCIEKKMGQIKKRNT